MISDAYPMRTLDELCEINIGKTPSRSNPSYWNGEHPWLSIADMKQGRILSKTKEQITDLGIRGSGIKSVPAGTILLSYKLSIGKIGITKRELYTNEAIAALPIINHAILCPEFLFWALQSIDLLATCDKAAMGKTLNKAKLKKLKIPLPPLAEQKRIAGILDTADALRDKRRLALAELDIFLQSTFIDMFGDPVTNPKGWKMVRIGDLLESANYGTSEKSSSEVCEYPVLRMNNITYEGGWDFSSLKYMELDEKGLSKYLVRKGQILFNRTNSRELVGKTAVYREDKPMAFAGYLIRGIVNEDNDAEYIGAFMNTPQIKQYLRSMCKSIVGMANINAKEFQKIPVAKPPLALQQQFAKFVTKVEAQKVRMREQLDELDTLFAALQQRAFNGEL